MPVLIPAHLHLSHSTASEVVSYMTPPSALMAHYPRVPDTLRLAGLRAGLRHIPVGQQRLPEGQLRLLWRPAMSTVGGDHEGGIAPGCLASGHRTRTPGGKGYRHPKRGREEGNRGDCSWREPRRRIKLLPASSEIVGGVESWTDKELPVRRTGSGEVQAKYSLLRTPGRIHGGHLVCCPSVPAVVGSEYSKRLARRALGRSEHKPIPVAEKQWQAVLVSGRKPRQRVPRLATVDASIDASTRGRLLIVRPKGRTGDGPADLGAHKDDLRTGKWTPHIDGAEWRGAPHSVPGGSAVVCGEEEGRVVANRREPVAGIDEAHREVGSAPLQAARQRHELPCSTTVC